MLSNNSTNTMKTNKNQFFRNAWAELNDFQIWLERVSENEKPTVLIEDGHVAGEAGSNETPTP